MHGQCGEIWRESDLASESPLETDQVKRKAFALTSANLVPPKLNFHPLCQNQSSDFFCMFSTPDSQVGQNHIGAFHLTRRSVEASTVVPHEPRAEMQASVSIAHGNFFTLSDKVADAWGRQVQPPWVQVRAEQATTEAYTMGGGGAYWCLSKDSDRRSQRQKVTLSWPEAGPCCGSSGEEVHRKNNSIHMTCRSWHKMKREGLSSILLRRARGRKPSKPCLQGASQVANHRTQLLCQWPPQDLQDQSPGTLAPSDLNHQVCLGSQSRW